jgi:hypothetical protein
MCANAGRLSEGHSPYGAIELTEALQRCVAKYLEELA